MTTKTPAASPTEIYLAGLSSGSRQGMRQALDVIAGILSDDADAERCTASAGSSALST